MGNDPSGNRSTHAAERVGDHRRGVMATGTAWAMNGTLDGQFISRDKGEIRWHIRTKTWCGSLSRPSGEATWTPRRSTGPMTSGTTFPAVALPRGTMKAK